MARHSSVLVEIAKHSHALVKGLPVDTDVLGCLVTRVVVHANGVIDVVVYHVFQRRKCVIVAYRKHMVPKFRRAPLALGPKLSPRVQKAPNVYN